MKRILYIVVGLLIIGGLAYWATNLEKKSKATDTSLIAFSIEDTASVDRIEIYDSYHDQHIDLKRGTDGAWETNDGMCVQQGIVNTMLETMKKITLKGYVPKNAMGNMKKMLMAQYKEVKIYQKGKWVKTWYVGHSTRDHHGTHMLLETPDLKSDNPVIMGMKGFYGVLGPRFFADPRRFECTNLFSFERSELKKVELINRVEPENSYTIEIKSSDDYVVSSQGEILTNINKDNLVFYLNSFKNMHYNQPNYALSEKVVDSIRNSPADYDLSIQGKENSYHLKMYRRIDPDDSTDDNLVWDETYLWGIKEDGQLVRMQYYNVGPLIEGKMVFSE